MDKTLLFIAATLLEQVAYEFSNRSCNDYELEDTPENRKFIGDMIADSDYPEDELSIREGKLLVMDSDLMSYCSKLLLRGAA